MTTHELEVKCNFIAPLSLHKIRKFQSEKKPKIQKAFRIRPLVQFYEKTCTSVYALRYTNVNLKISQCVQIHIKTKP